MQTNHIHYLTVLNNTRSINQAARLLNLTPSYLSKVLKNAEAELGMPLFIRTREGLQPIASAESVLQGLCQMDQIYRSIIHPSADNTEVSGNYTFYCLPTISSGITPQLFQMLTEKFSSVTLQYMEASEQKTIQAVSQKSHSFGIIISIKDEFEPNLPDNVQMVHNIFSTRLAILVFENHPLAKNRSISLDRLLKYDLIFYDNSSEIENNCIFHFLSNHGKPHVKYCINSLPTFLSILREGSCIACVSQDGSYKDGFKVLHLRENISITYSLICNADDIDSPLIQFFAETITQLFIERYRSRLPILP